MRLELEPRAASDNSSPYIMALVAGTPDGTLRPGARQPSSISQGPDVNEEVLKALETYKKKDNSKGERHVRIM